MDTKTPPVTTRKDWPSRHYKGAEKCLEWMQTIHDALSLLALHGNRDAQDLVGDFEYQTIENIARHYNGVQAALHDAEMWGTCPICKEPECAWCDPFDDSAEMRTPAPQMPLPFEARA